MSDHTKICTHCGEDKPLDDFYHYKNGGPYGKCKSCHSVITSDWHKNNSVKCCEYSKAFRGRLTQEEREYRNWKSMLKTHWNMTPEDYANMLDSQNGVCAICGNGETAVRNGKVKRLAIDHDHDTGEIRGLLCQSCNTGIGLLGDDIDTYIAAINYLH